jgi:hypothetical protein
MGFDQYHEPPDELPAETRTFARLCASLTEVAKSVMANAVGEEYKHFCMDLEFLLRQKPEWRAIALGILFQEGDIVEHGEAAEAAADDDDPTVVPMPSGSASLGIGGLKGRAA